MGADEITGVECGLPDIAGFTIDQLRTTPGSVLAAALERLEAEAAEPDEPEYTAWAESS